MKKRSFPVMQGVLLFNALAAILFMLGIGIVMYSQLGKVIYQYQEDLLERQALNVQKTVEGFFERHEIILADYAEFPLIQQAVMHPEQSEATLADFMGSISLLGQKYQLTLLDYTGTAIHSTQAEPSFRYADDKQIKRVLDGKAEHEYGISLKNGESYWRICTPVYYANHVEGALVAEIPIRRVDTFYSMGLSKSSWGLEIEYLGQTVARFGKELDVRPDIFPLDIVNATVLFRWDKSRFDVTRRKLLTRVVLSAVGLSLLLALFSGGMMRRFFASPLRGLRKVAHDIANGSLKERAPEGQIIQEIDLLARDFNVMAGRVSARESALKSARELLETRVQERTKELDDALQTVKGREAVVTAMNEASHDALTMIDSQARVVFWNPAAEKMFGYSAQEAIGRDIHDLVAPPEARDQAREGMARFSRSGEGTVVGVVMDFEAMRKDGSRFSVERAVSSFFHQGEWYAVGSIRDVTDRKKTEEELKRLSLVAQHTDNAVVISDGDGRAQWVNDAFTRITGYRLDEVFGKKPGRLLQGRNTDVKTVQFISEQLRKGLGFQAELLNYAKDGREYWLSLDVQPVFDDEGEISNFIAVESDITQQKQLEGDLLDARDAADAANLAKSEFLARMSHEIRTPMNAIMGLGHLALNTELNSQQRDYLQKIYSSAESLLGIINDILDFSKIEAGQMTLEAVRFNLDEVLQDVRNLMGFTAEEKGLRLAVHVGENVPRGIEGDSLRLKQVLTNLVSNAVKFTHEGEVAVRVTLAEQGEQSEDKVSLHFEIRDSGIGMTPEQLSRLFRSFAQADESTTRKYGGTGLGLAICKRLVELMGGDIQVDSEEGTGSVFFFDLTFDRSDEVVSWRMTRSELRGRHVLVVEDSRTSMEIFSSQLKSLGLKVSEAYSGMQAVEFIKNHGEGEDAVEVAFIDWKMAGMDGLETAGAIQRLTTLEQKPAVVIFTAYDRSLARQHGQGLDIDAYLDKPVNSSDLVDVLMQIFRGDDKTQERVGLDISQYEGLFKDVPILLVEDNAINQQVATELLSKAGFVVDVAHNGLQALGKLERGQYAAVLMDIQMPEMDGIEATQRIRRDARFDALPIIAMTAHALEGDRQRSLEAGMNEHVSKPIEPEKLFAVLQSILSEQESLLRVRPDEQQASASAPAPVSAEKPFPTELPGVEIQTGLTRVGGKRSFYIKLLGQFIEEYSGVVDELKGFESEENYTEARRVAHTIKGVGGNLGMSGIQETAYALEKNYAENRLAGEHFAPFEAAFTEVLAGLREYFGDESEEGEGQDVLLGNDERDALLQQLGEQLEAQGFSARKLFEQLKETLRAQSDPKGVDALDLALQEFDFLKAQELFAELRKTLEK